MLIFIRNTPRTYAWGSKDALPEMLGTQPTDEPQAELWLGSHPESPAKVAKAAPGAPTLIDLIESDPEHYGVDGGRLPFLLKVLAIGAPLSLQVHPDAEQAAAGFAEEEAAGVPLDAPHRNYGDPSHKPEVLVALSELTALCGFRSLEAVQHDLRRMVSVVGSGDGRAALQEFLDRCGGAPPAQLRRSLLEWVLSDDPRVALAVAAVSAAVRIPGGEPEISAEDARRRAALRGIAAAHPGDPGILVALLLNLVHLSPGEAVYLSAGHVHAYLSGIGVEVMAASDNVLRAGLTRKHRDPAELMRIACFDELERPTFPHRRCAEGLVSWEPDVPDFRLLRARLHRPEGVTAYPGDSAESVRIATEYPHVLIATEGVVRVERPEAEWDEVANVRRGQSLYISAGEDLLLSGEGEVFLATVGRRGADSGRL